MHPGQKLASIYRSGVSCRIIISRNWSRENSLLVSRTGILLRCDCVLRGEEGRGEREIIPHLAAMIARLRDRELEI